MRIASLMLLTLLICISCGGGDDEPQKEGNCLTAVIDGDDFTAESTTGTSVTTTVDYENLGSQETDLLTIIGTIPNLSGDITTITLSFACSEFTSDLDVVNSDADCGISMDYTVQNLSNPTASIIVSGTSGSISVAELSDSKISGTFSFSGTDQNGTEYVITDGFFDTTIN